MIGDEPIQGGYTQIQTKGVNSIFLSRKVEATELNRELEETGEFLSCLP